MTLLFYFQYIKTLLDVQSAADGHSHKTPLFYRL